MNPAIEKQLRLCPTLPTLSSVALKIIDIGRNPDVDLNDVAQLLANDPALASKTLRVANSPLYTRGREARNLRQAVTVLGLNATVSLALSFSLSAELDRAKSDRIDLDGYWRRALLCAVAAQLLGDEIGIGAREELFLAGLLQDLGILALDAALPHEYAAAVQADGEHESLIERERAAFDVDHCEAGAWLMQRWGLPDYLWMTTCASHATGPVDIPPDLAQFAACVAVSGRIAIIYLDRDTDSATRLAFEAAQNCLGLSRERLGQVLSQVGERLAEVEALFDTPLLSATQAAGLTAQAHELLTSRNLQLLETATRHQVREEEYQRRAHRLDEMARKDPLTGLFNRRHFDEVLANQFAESEIHDGALSVAYLDLDHFKAVNDDHGHPVGDKILLAVANSVRSHLREHDLLARYGGEEFVLLMPQVDEAAAEKIVNRIREAVEALEHDLDDGSVLRITLSAGVASHPGVRRRVDCPEALVQAADYALYDAKRQGRNRVSIAC